MNWIQLLFLLVVSIPLGASTLEVYYSTTSLGGSDYRYTYTLRNYTFQAGEELAIAFSTDQYGSISNGSPIGSPEWDLLLFDIGFPPGAPGIYSLFALVDSPDTSVTFAVNFTWIGAGMPGAQPFSLNAYDPDTFEFLEVLQTGFTQSDADPVIPEPGTALLLLSGVLLTALRRVRKMRRAPR